MKFFSKLAHRKDRTDVPSSSSPQPVTISTSTQHSLTPQRPHIPPSECAASERDKQASSTTIHEDRSGDGHRGHSYKEVSISGHSRSHVGDVHGNVTNNYWPSGPSPKVEEQEQLVAKGRLAEEREIEDQKRIAFLQALEFEAMGSRFATISSAHVNTCAWIVDTPQYTHWRDESLRDDHHGVLWIKGNPGSGKSTLIKYALEVAERCDGDETVVSFFFNARGQPIESSTEGMYRALLHQILSQLPRLYSGRTHVERPTWSVEMLENMLRTTLLSLKPDEHLTCYIDALDECAQDEVRDAVALFEDLGDRATTEKIPLSICFSSRHYPHITMHKHEEIVVDSLDEHLEDISKYVQDSLSRMRIANPLKAEIETIIERRCSGVFLWVNLVIKILKEKHDQGASRPELIHSLEAIPEKLQDLFAKLLEKPNEEMILAFQWLLHAKQRLTTVELYFAIKTGVSQLSTGKWNEVDVDQQSMERFQLRSTRGLVGLKYSNIRRRTYPQFIHESVREHLLAGGLASLIQDEQHALQAHVHARLAQYCLSYIQLDSSTYMRSRDQNPLKVRYRDFPFLRYAVTNMFPHMETARTGRVFRIEALDAIPLGLIRSVRMVNAKKAGGLPVTTSATLVYLVLEDRCCALAKLLVSRRPVIKAPTVMPNQKVAESTLLPDVNAHCGGEFGCALGAAVHSGSIELVQLLLDHGAEPNIRPENCISPLMLAIRQRREDIAQLLISRGAEVNFQIHDGGNALEFAAWVGSTALANLMLLNGADSNIAGGDFGSPLGSAVAACCAGQRRDSMADHGATVRLLLDHGARVNLWQNKSPLWVAASGCDSKMVRYLLDLGADVDARDDVHAYTPLCASTFDHLLVTRFRGVRNRELTMKELLDGGADVNAIAKHGVTPLIAASRLYASESTASIIQLLLDHGADVQHRGETGTALDAAWSQPYDKYDEHRFEVVRLLWNATFPESELTERALSCHLYASQHWAETRSIDAIYYSETADGSHGDDDDGPEGGDFFYYSDEVYDTDQSYKSDASIRSTKTL